jgi:hypothetical protein
MAPYQLPMLGTGAAARTGRQRSTPEQYRVANDTVERAVHRRYYRHLRRIPRDRAALAGRKLGEPLIVD